MIKDKNILIISPQSWNSRKVSKHHYAEEFAKTSKVYFLNPPSYGFLDAGIKYHKISDSLSVISLTLPIPRFFKFKLEKVFRFFLINSFNKLISQINEIDFLWNFDNGTYFKEEYLFSKAVKVFHPVDDFELSKKFNHYSYDVGFAVSPEILFKIPLKHKFFINHGVNDLLLVNNYHLNKVSKIKPENIVYVGNLSIRFLDSSHLIKIISENKDIQFDFVGDYDAENQFIHFLKTQDNVSLLGPKFGDELEKKIREADILLLCYKQQPGYFADNSHKVLEYLSSGNVIVSSHLSVYKGLELFPMSNDVQNLDYSSLFQQVVNNFASYNTNEIRNRRIKFAKDNTYAKQVERINKYLNEVA